VFDRCPPKPQKRQVYDQVRVQNNQGQLCKKLNDGFEPDKTPEMGSFLFLVKKFRELMFFIGGVLIKNIILFTYPPFI
jgi:hypothetical protein